MSTPEAEHHSQHGQRGAPRAARPARSVQDAAATVPGAPTTTRRLGAEALGTFVLVLGGCGAAVLAASTTTTKGVPVGIGYTGVALAFGLSVLVMAYAVGPVSGGHFNPAVSVGLATAGRFAWRDVPAYVVAQLLGGTAGAAVLKPAWAASTRRWSRVDRAHRCTGEQSGARHIRRGGGVQ